MFWKIGCLLGSTGVAAGAFGAHGLNKKLDKDPQKDAKINSWKTAANYQLVHALALLAWSAHVGTSKVLGVARFAPWFITAGTLMFAGSIYLLVLLPAGHSMRKVMGPTTPLGGLLMIGGWTMMAML